MNNLKKVFFIGLVFLGAILFFTQKQQAKDIIFDNVEALASSENGGKFSCYYAGSLDCDGSKAEYVSTFRFDLTK